MTASRSTRAALPIRDICGARGDSHRAVRLMLITSRLKTEMLQLRLMEKKRELRMDEVNELIDGICLWCRRIVELACAVCAAR